MFHRIGLRAAAMLAALALGACTNAVQLTQAWRSETYAGPKFTKILVIGVGEDVTTRRLFEDSFSASLARSGVPAIAAYTVLPNVPQPSAQQLQQAAAAAGADAALVTRLLHVRQHTQTSPGYISAVPAYGYYGGFYGAYNSMVVVQPPTSYTYDVATLETNLWSLQGKDELVWSAISKSFTPDQVAAIGAELATEVSAALQDAGLAI